PCFPNPFNPETTLRFELGKAADVSVQVYDLLGNLVNTLTNSAYQPGEYSLSWNGRDAHDRLSATGIYFLCISSGTGFSSTQKVIFLR
ncbi:T9SS type A sorting domain-containing protein, partial [bacterium]|nr:T9SS type A sorting domain-containing protein [bacterium]MBU1633795.1 T9SS type A sorting domain-containing protein [bacterium]